MKKYLIIQVLVIETNEIKCLVYTTTMFKDENAAFEWINDLCNTCKWKKLSTLFCDKLSIDINI